MKFKKDEVVCFIDDPKTPYTVIGNIFNLYHIKSFDTTVITLESDIQLHKKYIFDKEMHDIINS